MLNGPEVPYMEGQQPSDLPKDGQASAGVEPLNTGTAESQKRIWSLCKVGFCTPFPELCRSCLLSVPAQEPRRLQRSRCCNSPQRISGQEKKIGPKTEGGLRKHLDETSACEWEGSGQSMVPVQFLFPQLSAGEGFFSGQYSHLNRLGDVSKFWC